MEYDSIGYSRTDGLDTLVFEISSFGVRRSSDWTWLHYDFTVLSLQIFDNCSQRACSLQIILLFGGFVHCCSDEHFHIAHEVF